MRVRIETGARLHFGFYNLMPVRRLWGSIGLAVDGVGYDIVIEEGGNGIVVEGCQRARFHRILLEALERLRLGDMSIKLVARKCIPEHRGLGSTTQAKLAVYAGLARLASLDIDVYKLAELAGRGKVSGVGIAAFAYGGFIIDTGRRVGVETGVPKPMMRIELPEKWRIVYLTPMTSWRVAEEGEVVFQGSIDPTLHCTLLETVFTWLAPAAVEKDFESFTAALEEIERIMGMYFSKAQEGAYCCRETAAAAEELRRAGGRGVGQSSWGPTVYAFFPDEESARTALNQAASRLEQRGIRLEYYGVLKPRNRGAVVTLEG
ncbi:GHMP kinase [Pyrolobus fumarii 1A]|uniref:Beta-ribofuranosylaminobenzene 5'-phosphate synthase n=1 Tax=Pyrolobus fumarii (strain DSM 11204 / 1A) TaxID=694429 RepID=G0EGD9_PYRF1|nr:GHMP kinase [Pyrolobus fumarii]AEM39164.1 GHMP kinase [Pyrolobus fumarii 1A]